MHSNMANPYFLGGNMGNMGNMSMGGHMGPGMMGPGMGPIGPQGMPPDPANNNQPLQFNTNKGKPPMAIPGDSKDVDLRPKLDENGGDASTTVSDNMMGMGGMGAMSMAGWGPMMGPGMPPMGDPSMMMGYGAQYGFMGTPMPMDGTAMMAAQKEVITLKDAVLYPPSPNAPPPSLRERPPGCRTIFVGGLPETCTEEILREMFENCGSITSIRLSKKNFAHVRFDFEESVDKAIYLSGYRIKIENKEEKQYTGRLHVDYAQARDDLYEWECKQRSFAREERHRMRIEEERLRPPSPPPVTHFSDHEAALLMESLKTEEGFVKGSQILVTWLDRGDCNRRTANTFYSLVQSTNSHVRRLMSEKAQHDEELIQMKMKFRQRMEGILRQFEQIEKVFAMASKQKSWDHFSKAQRKNLDMWRKQAQEIKLSQQEEFFKERDEAEMEMSDSEDGEGPSSAKKKKPADTTPEAHAISAQDWAAMSQHRIENENLKMQLEAYKNEVELLKHEVKEAQGEDKERQDKQIKALQQALQGMQQQLIAAKQEIKKSEEEVKTLRRQAAVAALHQKKEKAREGSESEGGGKEDEANGGMAGDDGLGLKEDDSTTAISSSVQPLTDKEARLIGLLSTFLHVHPFGASVDYIWSYLSRLDIRIRTSELEDLLEKFPGIYRQDIQGVGVSVEKRWKFIGFETL